MIRPQSIQVGSRIALTTFLCLLLVLSPVAAATGGMGANTSNGTTNDTIASDGATGEVDTSGNVSTSSTSNDASGNASNTSTDASNNTSGNVSNTSTDASNSEPVRVAGTAEDGSIGLTATSDGTNGTNDSAVRNLTESIITSDLNATYDRIYERGLNAEYWDSVSEDRAQTVVENTIGTFKPTGRDVAQSILEKAAQRAGVTTSYATNAMLIAEVGANYLMFAAAIDASNIGPNMRLANYDAVRNDLQDLQQSTQDIRTADTYAEKRDAFEERRSTLRSLYTKLPTYTNGIHSNIQENPIYDINFIDSGGVNWNLGRSSYSTIRLQTEALRQQLVADYQYTDSWLANETTNASLAADTGVDMPRHRLDFSTQATRYYDTIDTAGDYTIYRVSPPESITGADKDLRVRIATADPENVSATLSTSKPSPGDIGSGENFRTRRSDLITTVEGVESTDYYVAVKSDRPAFYKFEASVYHPYLLGAVRLNNSGPPVAPVEAGSSGSEGSESVSEPAPPDPELECTCITPTEDGFTVGVTATNRGGESAWQSVAVSLPNVTNASNVEIRSHNLDYAQVYTGEVASAYGTANVTTSYPLVEGAATNWSQGERKHLELHVTAPPNTTYDVYAKSVARGDGAWTAAPEIGATDTTDQQREFVRVKEYTHAETSFNRTTAWETVGGNRGHTGTNPTPDAPTHNVSQEWRRTLDGQPAHSPTVVGDRAYITTTNDTVYGLDRTNGTELWRFYAPTALSSAPTYENGTLYVSSPARVYVLNAHTGTQLCDCAFGLNEKDAATPVVKDDTLYVTARVGDQYDTDEGAVYAFDRTSRSVEWRRQFGNHAIDVPPAVTDTTVYVAARDGTVWALDRRTGNTRWRKSFSGFRGAPTVRDGTVYLGDTNGNVYALDTNGDVRWRYRAGYGIHESLAVDDERVYANAGDRLVALDRTEGTWRWSYRAGNQLTTAPAVANGTVYVGSKEAQRVYGVDTGDGTERWRYYTDLVRTAPALTDNELYVGAGESLIALTGGTDAPSAAFTPSTTTPETGVEVTFDAGSTADGTAPLTYEWDLTGDGTFNHTGEQVTRAFPSAGTVWPTLRVTDANGASDTTTERIAVAPSGGHWITRGGDYAHTASLPSVHGPTHNVTQAWSAPMGGTVSAPPTVENDTVYVAADGGQVRALSRDGTERWSVDVGATPLSPTVANGTAYVAASNNRVYAFDVATGDLQWSYNTGDKGITQAIVYEDSVYVTTRVGDSYDTDEGAVYALDPETGQREWHQEFGNQPIDAPAAISSTTVYVATQNGEVRALDRLSGTQRWMKSFGGGFDSAPTLQDGTLYVGNKNGDVVALESSNGNERWRYHTGYSVHHSLAVDGDRVYANVGERLVALTRAGRWAWTQRFDDPLSTAPTVTNRTVYVGSKEAQRVYGLDAADGTERWRYYTSRVHSAPVVDNGTVYVGARQSLDALTGGTGGPSARADLSTTTPETGTEVALDAGSTTLASGRTATYRWDLTGDGTFNHTGEQVTEAFGEQGNAWVTLNVTDSAGASDTVRRRITVQPTEPGWARLGGDRGHTGDAGSVAGPTHDVESRLLYRLGGAQYPPVVTNGTAYVTDANGAVRAVDRRTGHEYWRSEVGATPHPPTAANGRVYVAASNNRVYAFDGATGELQWSYNTGDKGISRVVEHRGLVYVATRVGDSYDTDEGAVYALDPETGQREWHQEFGNQPIDSPPVVTDTTVYVATQKGEVRALDRLSGTQRWMKSLGGGFDSAPTLRDGTLYLGNKNGDVIALDVAGENTVWRYSAGSSIHQSLAVDDERVYVPAGDRLIALSRGGEWRWSHRVEDAVTTAPTVTNRTVYVGSKEAQQVYGFDTSDGTERWRHYTNRVRASPVVVNRTVYVGARRSLYALTGRGNAPSAAFTPSTTTPETGVEVSFDAGSTTLASGRTATYRWDLTGDGTFNHTGEQVTEAFGEQGNAWVTLNVTDSAGASDTVRRRITVQPTEPGWARLGGDRGHTGDAGSVAGPTHDVESRLLYRLGGAQYPPVVTNGTAYVTDANGAVRAVDRRTGHEYWRSEVGATPHPPTAANGRVYVAASNNRVYAFDGATGELQWSYNTGDKGISRVVEHRGLVYVATRVGDSYDTDEGAVYALDPETGQREWHQEFGNQPIDSPPVVTDTTVYVATQKGEVRALDRLSGTPRWTESFSGGFDSAPTIRDNTLYVGNKNGDVLALDPSDGSTEWSRSIEGSIHRSLAVSDERVYAVAGDELVAVSRSNHSERWTFQADGVLTTPPVVTDGTAYVGSKEGQRIYGVDTFDGSERWRHYTSRLTDGLALVNDTLYYGTRGGLTALTGETGAPSAAIEYAPENPTRNVSVNLTARARDADGEVVTYAWDLDDDGVFNEADGTNATTSFDVPGEHTVRLRVTDDQGVSDTATAVITVPDDRRPNAALYASDTVVATGETVRFNASNSTDAVGIERIAWRVNNESAGTGPTLARTFDSPGNYTVLVRVTDGAGNTGTAFATVSVVGSFGENLSANRTITGSLRPGTNATVTLRARANTTVNGLAVREEIPAGLTVLSKSSSPTATYREETREWLWRDAAPNETYTVEYTVRIPGDATFGTAYNFSGAVSAYAQQPAPVAGDQSLPVAACLNRVVAGSDRTLSVTEVQRALAWWANDTAVPNTNGRHIGMERMQRFVHAWQTGSQVECGSLEDTASVGTATGPGVLNTMATADVPTVAQSPNVSVTWENDTVTVETVVESGTLDAPGLDLSLPAGWDVVSQSARNATYRASDDQWVWLTEGPKTLAYTLSVPANASNGTAALAADGSGIGSAGAYRETTDTTALQVDNAGLRARTAILSAVHNAESTLRLDLDADSAVDIEHVSVRSPTDTTLGVRNLSGQHAAATVSPTLRNATWNGTDYESATYTVVVTNDAGRSWTQNVSIRVFEAGDATGDGAVDIFDAVAVGTSFDATRENATYSPAADLNNDGEVDVLDATLIGRNWDGRSEAG